MIGFLAELTSSLVTSIVPKLEVLYAVAVSTLIVMAISSVAYFIFLYFYEMNTWYGNPSEQLDINTPTKVSKEDNDDMKRSGSAQKAQE